MLFHASSIYFRKYVTVFQIKKDFETRFSISALKGNDPILNDFSVAIILSYCGFS
jgi:hypothetical protein